MLIHSWLAVHWRLFWRSLKFGLYLHCMVQCCLHSGKCSVKGFEILPIVRAGFKLLLWKAPPKQGRCPGLYHTEVTQQLVCIGGICMCWGSVPEPRFPVREFKYDFRPAWISREGSSPSPSLLKRECSRLALKELFLQRQRQNLQMTEGERQPRDLRETSPDAFSVCLSNRV